MVHLQQKNEAVRLGITQAIFIIQYLWNKHPTVNIPNPSPETLTEWIMVSKTIHPKASHISSLLPSRAVLGVVDTVVTTFQALAEKETLCKVAFCNPNTLPCTGEEAGAPGVRIGNLSPVEFVLILVLIARHPSAKLALLARHIKALRNLIHKEFEGEKKYNKKLFDLYSDWERAEFPAEETALQDEVPGAGAESSSKGKKRVSTSITTGILF